MSGRRRRPSQFPEQVRNWLDAAGHEQRQVFLLAIGALSGDRRKSHMEPYHPRSLSRGSGRCVLQLGGGLLLVWEDSTAYPDFFDVIYVGRLPDWPSD